MKASLQVGSAFVSVEPVGLGAGSEQCLVLIYWFSVS